MIEINRDPSKSDLRWFGLVLGAFLGVVGAVVRYRLGWPGVATGVWAAAGTVVVLYYAIPALRRPLWIGWMVAAFPIGWVLSHVVLGLVWYIVVTPVGWAIRASGRDPLRRRPDRDRPSYWIAREPRDDASRYFRQF